MFLDKMCFEYNDDLYNINIVRKNNESRGLEENVI